MGGGYTDEHILLAYVMDTNLDKCLIMDEVIREEGATLLLLVSITRLSSISTL